jgi:hypothetical protein
MYDTETIERTPASKNAEIRDMIKRVRMEPKADNRPVLGVNIIKMEQAKKGGFPKHMYHETLEAVCDVSTEEEEMALASKGYVSHYIPQAFPLWLYRRNLDAKFEAEGFVEAIVVQSEDQMHAITKRKVPKGCSEWAKRVTDLAPIPDGPEEDPAVTIARLEGQLSEARNAKSKKEVAA